MSYVTVTQEEFQTALAALNDTYGVASLGGVTVVVSQNGLDFNGKACDIFMRIEEFKRYWSHENWLVTYPKSNGASEFKYKNLINEWLRWPERRTYKGIVFCPEDNAPEDCYNLWKGFAIEPIAGDCSLFWHHLLDVICDGDTEAFTYLQNYMAHAVQKIGELPEVALVFRGQQGIGKDAFITAFKEIFGKHYLVLSNMEDVTSKFNGPMMDKIIIQANEATWGGDRKNDGVLKTMITDKTRKYEFKGKDIIQANNYTRLLIVSNNDWVVPVDKDDRRYVFFNVSSKHKQDSVYFGKLYEQLRNGGYAAILHELLQHDITQFQPRNRPTCLIDAGIDQVYKRMSTVELFIEDSLQTGRLANITDCEVHSTQAFTVSFQQLYTDFVAYCENTKASHTPSTKEFSHQVFGFKSKGGLLPAEKASQRYIKGIGKRSLCYSLPPLKVCREYFEKVVLGGRKVEWDDETELLNDLEYDHVADSMLTEENDSDERSRLPSTQQMITDDKEHRKNIKWQRLHGA